MVQIYPVQGINNTQFSVRSTYMVSALRAGPPCPALHRAPRTRPPIGAPIGAPYVVPKGAVYMAGDELRAERAGARREEAQARCATNALQPTRARWRRLRLLRTPDIVRSAQSPTALQVIISYAHSARTKNKTRRYGTFRDAMEATARKVLSSKDESRDYRWNQDVFAGQ